MNAYGTLLKKLIRFTNIKLSNIAEIVGYDTSYISKWCNKDKLPAPKASANVNKLLAGAFSNEIILQEEVALFCREFQISAEPDAEHLTRIIHTLLKDAYKKSYNAPEEDEKSALPSGTRVLLWQPDIREFFRHEFPQMLSQHMKPCDILCTLNICQFLPLISFETGLSEPAPQEINLRAGISLASLTQSPQTLKSLYYLVNQYNHVNFDFYNNELMDKLNLIVIKDIAAIQCAIDHENQITMLTIITDIPKVNAIYQKTAASFKANQILIHRADSEELYRNGYRTDFYAHNAFQLFITRGFEFLLPSDVIPSLVETSRSEGFDDSMGNLIQQLQITWEEIFEKGCLDFYILKTSLMRYISDGTIYFADVVYRMTVDQLKKQIEYILETTKKNPNIRFYVIDDENIPNAANLMHISIYNNMHKMFLKNIDQYGSHKGTRFYTIQNDILIREISDYFNALKKNTAIYAFDAEKLQLFYDKYGTMIYRMFSLHEDN